jgi:hypothetical protein
MRTREFQGGAKRCGNASGVTLRSAKSISASVAAPAQSVLHHFGCFLGDGGAFGFSCQYTRVRGESSEICE